MGTVRHLFPGGNTPQGFYSFYNHIISASATRIFVLKGGPGTGKSTFMRRIGEAMVAKGYDAEFHHCSSDNNSLDGLVIPQLQIAFIDGTAPHVVDPKNPGSVDEILHLGDYWDEKKLVRYKEKIIATNAAIGRNFQRAYRLLKAAKNLYDDCEAINFGAMDFAAANYKAAELLDSIFSGIKSCGDGRVRKLFASAITPNGPVNYLDSSVWHMQNCYVVTGDPGTGKSTLIQKVLATATAKGLDVEAFYCPLDPEKPEHLVIPALNTAITTSAPPHLYTSTRPAAVINMNECLNQGYLSQFARAISYDRNMFDELLTQAVSCIHAAKLLHDELETCYIPNMDFAGIEKLWEKTFARVLAYSEPHNAGK